MENQLLTTISTKLIILSFESKYFAKLETNYKKEKYKVQAYNSRNKLLGDTQSFQDKKIMNSIFSEMDLEEFQDNSSVLLKDEDIYETMKFLWVIGFFFIRIRIN